MNERQTERERENTETNPKHSSTVCVLHTKASAARKKKCTRVTDSTAIVLRLSSGVVVEPLPTNKQTKAHNMAAAWRDTAFDLFANGRRSFLLLLVFGCFHHHHHHHSSPQTNYPNEANQNKHKQKLSLAQCVVKKKRKSTKHENHTTTKTKGRQRKRAAIIRLAAIGARFLARWFFRTIFTFYL